jgi:hypothetical protein
VTNLVYKQGVLVQIRWTHCNKTNTFQRYQYREFPGSVRDAC